MNKILFAIIALLSACLLPGYSACADPVIPPGGTNLLPTDSVDDYNTFSNTTASSQVVAVDGEQFDKALKLTTIVRPIRSWDVQVVANTVAPMMKGDVCLAMFTMRTLQASGGYGRTNLIVENNSTYNKHMFFEASAGSTWTRIYAPFTAVEDDLAGQAHINFHMGFSPQCIELADIQVVDYGSGVALSALPSTQFLYAGHDAAAPWRAAAAKRIEWYRKGMLVVHVVNAEGKPVIGATVHVSQTRHAFNFGTELDNTFMGDTPESAEYRSLTYSLFNTAVIGNALKLEPWLGYQTGGYYTRAKAIQFVQTLREHGLAVRGHNLVWPSWTYSVVWQQYANNPQALEAAVIDHITDEVGALKGGCFEWDVVNEPYNNHDLQDILGPHCLVDFYKAAHAADPSARLYINDFGNTEDNGENTQHIDAYDAQIQYLLQNGAPLGGIGFQSHFQRELTPPETVYAILNRFARFGLPLKVTEFDVDGPDNQLKTDYLRDYMTICFSEPAMSGFLMWGFWAGDDGLPGSALYNKDFSINPNGVVYKDLVLHRWWTDIQERTGKSGSCTDRAFLGDYLITVSKHDRTTSVKTTITKNGAGVNEVTVRL